MAVVAMLRGRYQLGEGPVVVTHVTILAKIREAKSSRAPLFTRRNAISLPERASPWSRAGRACRALPLFVLLCGEASASPLARLSFTQAPMRAPSVLAA